MLDDLVLMLDVLAHSGDYLALAVCTLALFCWAFRMAPRLTYYAVLALQLYVVCLVLWPWAVSGGLREHALRKEEKKLKEVYANRALIALALLWALFSIGIERPPEYHRLDCAIRVAALVFALYLSRWFWSCVQAIKAVQVYELDFDLQVQVYLGYLFLTLYTLYLFSRVVEPLRYGALRVAALALALGWTWWLLWPYPYLLVTGGWQAVQQAMNRTEPAGKDPRAALAMFIHNTVKQYPLMCTVARFSAPMILISVMVKLLPFVWLQ